MKQNKYTKSARGQDCQVRIPGVCNFNPETVVFAHLNGGGMATKNSPISGAYCCSACHDVLDGRVRIKLRDYSDVGLMLKLWHYDGMKRTQDIMIAEGILILQGGDMGKEIVTRLNIKTVDFESAGGGHGGLTTSDPRS